MEQPGQIQSPWIYSNNTTSFPDEVEDCGFFMDPAHLNHSDFSHPFNTILDDPSNRAFLIPYVEDTMFSDDCASFPVPIDELNCFPLPSRDSCVSTIDGENEWASIETRMDMSYWKTSTSSPCQSPWSEVNFTHSMNTNGMTIGTSAIEPSPSFPTANMETDNQLRVLHLVMAYGEAMDEGHTELAEVIIKRMSEKVSPVGETVERLLYYMSQPLMDKQSDYLKLESSKNFYAAFKAFYQIFPYGKFAHFAANSAILEAMPDDAEIIHIYDFDTGDGIQWSTMIEALGHQHRELRLTSMRWSKGDSCNSLRWRFEETKRRLYDHATSFGLKLKVEEMELHNLMREMMQMSKNFGKREWFAFNCMVGLPHMGRVRSRRAVMDFFTVAKEFLPQIAHCNRNYMGIITLGDGESWVKLRNPTNFGSILDEYLVHFQALLESIESNFPVHLGEARTAMECLFVAPLVSSLTLLKKWEEIKESSNLKLNHGFEGWEVSKESLEEAKEMVRVGESLYGVSIEGEDANNEMVLEWRGIPLVKVSSWRK